MKALAYLNKLYTTALVRSIRAGAFIVLLFLVYQLQTDTTLVKVPLFLLNLLLMTEIFFHYKISKAFPSVTVEKNDGKLTINSFTRQAYFPFVMQPNGSEVMRDICKQPQIKRVMEKAGISHKDFTYPQVEKDILLQSSFDIAKTFKGTYVTTLDIFVAYLFLIEKEKKLLFAKQLKSEDLYNIVYWARMAFPEEEKPKKVRATFYGDGIGDWLVSGWTPETRKYASNFTNKALREEPILHGREAEFKKLVEALLKVDNSNALIVGDIGAGKENLVRALAYHSFAGNLGRYFNSKKIFTLNVGPFIAGTTNRADLEVRLQNVIAEVSHAGNVIVYIPEFQNILGASSYGLDLSAALLPSLQDGNLPIVATMTTANYKTYMEKNPLKQAFAVIEIKEPDQSTAIQMVMEDAKNVEEKYSVLLSYQSIRSAVELSGRFFHDHALPGSAISLLETVASSVSQDKNRASFDTTRRKMVMEEDIVKKVEEMAHVAIALPSGSEIELLLHLEDKLHERVIAQDEGIVAIAEAMRRIRSGMTMSQRPVSFLFLGPTGVGKTETAKALADFYFGGEKHMIRMDMSEYADEGSIKQLVDDLTDKIHDNPTSLILLDEFEKANPKIHGLFLQVLDDGRLTNSKGATASFRNAIIIATSNAGSEYVREAVEKKTPIDKAFQNQLIKFLETKNMFKPELLNRFDDIVTFKPLGPNEVNLVLKLMLDQITKTLAKQDITVTFDEAVTEKIASEGFDQEFGARPLRRYIQDNIEDLFAQKKLTGEISRGKKVAVAVDGTGAISLTIT